LSTNLISLLTSEIFKIILISFEIQTVEIKVISLEIQTCQQFEFELDWNWPADSRGEDF
jgi:hypothetical protein